MSVQDDTYLRLSTYTNLTTLVDTKIYPLTVPDDVELPYVTFFIVSDIPEHAMGSDADIRTLRIQVSCWSDDYDNAKAIEAQVKAALSRYRSGYFKDIFWDNSVDLYDGSTFQIAVDFIVYYEGV